jgi:DNA relaxase NicK
MSEIKLTIDEVIEHCEKTCERAEIIAQLRDAEIISKQYWEHKQVAEWLKELKQLRGIKERIIERLEEAKFPQKIGGEVEMVVLKKRIDEIFKEEGGIE